MKRLSAVRKRIEGAAGIAAVGAPTNVPEAAATPAPATCPRKRLRWIMSLLVSLS
jgi:hypothetical protein